MKKKMDSSTDRISNGKQKYEGPLVICYGDVATVTKGSGHGKPDGKSGTSKTCWIAEAIYGIDAPRTQLVRAWLNECYERGEPWSLVLVPLYRRFGRRIAAFLGTYPRCKILFRPLFDLAVGRAHRDVAATLLGMPELGNAGV